MKFLTSLFSTSCAGLYRFSTGSVLVLVLLLTGSPFINAQFVYYEGFTGTEAPGWEFAIDDTNYPPAPRLTAGTAPDASDPEYSSGAAEIDADGLGWLRLATVTGNQSNAVALDTAIPSSGNTIKIGFDFTMWKPGTATPADGITVFLWDASVTFDPGAFGGSLGYAQKTTTNGLDGAYVGVGLDVWGNFSNDQEGRQGAVNLDPTSPNYLDEIDIPDPLNPGQIAVRGPDEVGDGTGNYYYLGGTGGNDFTDDINGDTTWDSPISSLTDSITFNNYNDRPDQDAADYRYFEMELTSTDELIVRLQVGYTGSLTELFTLDLSDSYFDRPDQLRIGFAAATGGALNVHEIRNLSIETSGGSNSFYWDNEYGDQLWSSGTNWDPSDTVPADYAHVIFSDGYDDTQTDHTVTVDGGTDKTLHSVTFTGTTSYTLDPDSSEALIMDTNTTGGISYINMLNNPDGNADQTINLDIEMNNDLKIQNLVEQTLIISGDIDNGGNDLYSNSHGDTELSGVISGNGELTKQGAGTTVLSGNNTYSGNTTVEEGILQIEHNNALGDAGSNTEVEDGASLALANNITTPTGESIDIQGTGVDGQGAIFNVSGSNTYTGDVDLDDDTTIGALAGTLTFSGDDDLDGNDHDLTVDPSSGATIIFNRNIYDNNDGGAATDLIKEGTGTVILNYNNNYTGTTTINSGVLEIQNGGALGDTGNDTVINSGGTLALSGSIIVSGSETFTATGNGATGKAAIWNESGNNELDGTIAMTGTGASFGAENGTSIRIDGAVSGTGNATITGDGVVIWASPMSYTGDTLITSGTLQYADAGNRINDSSDIVVSSGATFDLNNFSDTVGSLAGAGDVDLGSATLTAGGNNVSTTYSGDMSGAGSFTKNGTGTMTFTGENTFSGTLTINNGTLAITEDETFADVMDLSLNGGTLSLDGITETMDDLTLVSSSVIDFLGEAGGILEFDDINYTAGTLTIDNWVGDLDGGGDTQLLVDTNVLGAFSTNITFAGWDSGAHVVANGTLYEIVPELTNFYIWDGSDANFNWTDRDNWQDKDGNPSGSSPNATGAKVLISDIDDLAGDTIDLGNSTRTVGTLVVDNDYAFTLDGGNAELTFDNTGSNTANLLVQGGASLTLDRSLNQSDDLRVYNNSTAATGLTIGTTVGAEDIDTNGNTLEFTGSGLTIVNNQIVDTGDLVKDGSGTLRLNDNNTYSGGTTLEEGTLQLGDNAALGTGIFTIEGGTVEAYGAARTITNDLDLNNLTDNAFTIGGSYNLTFSDTATQNVNLPSSSLEITVENGITATFNAYKNLQGTGELIKEGTGTLALSGDDNNFSGGLTVNAGTVSSTAAELVTLGSNDGGNNYLGSGDITVNSGGTLALTVTGGNNIDLNGTMTNTGGTINVSATGNNSDFFLDGELNSSGGTTNLTIDDVLDMGANADLTVSGGTVNMDVGSFTTSNNNGNIDVSGTGTLNIDMSGGTGGGTFLLDDNDNISVDGSGANINIWGSSTASNITFGGDLSLTNSGTVTVEQGYTYLDGDTNIDGGSAATAGTLVVKGNLSVDEPAISNSPNLTIDVSGASSITAPNTGSSITDLGTLTKTGTGTTTINGTNINNIEAADLILDQGSLQLGASDQIANTVDMTFQGGVFDTNGYDEIVNSLTLTETSWIDLGAGDSILKFKSTTTSGTRTDGYLVIQAWSGTPVTGGGTDQVIFGSSLSETFLANVYWEDQNVLGAIQLPNGEIVPAPIPEPGTILTACLLAGFLGWHGFHFFRRRRKTGL